MKYDENGFALPDPKPVEVPLKWSKIVSRREETMALIRGMLSQQAAQMGHESFEDAQDFEVEDDPLPASPHEFEEDDRRTMLELQAHLRDTAEARRRAALEKEREDARRAEDDARTRGARRAGETRDAGGETVGGDVERDSEEA